MDSITRSHYETQLELAFLKKRGEEFQSWFSSVMSKRYPADFTPVIPWGSDGDRKNDGYLTSRRMIFQCSAPRELRADKCVAKIEEDFAGAVRHWRPYFDTWVLVHNSRDGLPPHVLDKLLQLRKAHAPLEVKQWGFEELRQEVMALSEEDLASLFGPAPSVKSLVDLGMQDLAPVLDQIARLPALTDPDLRPVPADKLHRNQLSDSVGTLLRAGMSRSDLVKHYFKLNPLLQDQLAESFRRRYHELRMQNQSPDDVFHHLQVFAGGDRIGSPTRQSAVLAVLAFFFEECDIFLRPEPLVDVP
jgi:hypothetical protein